VFSIVILNKLRPLSLKLIICLLVIYWLMQIWYY